MELYEAGAILVSLTTIALLFGTVPGIKEFKVLWRMGNIKEFEVQLVRMVINSVYKCVV